LHSHSPILSDIHAAIKPHVERVQAAVHRIWIDSTDATLFVLFVASPEQESARRMFRSGVNDHKRLVGIDTLLIKPQGVARGVARGLMVHCALVPHQ